MKERPALAGVLGALVIAFSAILVDLVLENTEGSTSTVVTNLSYPLGDVLLLSAVFGVFSLTGWRPGPRWLVLGLGTAMDECFCCRLRPRPVGAKEPFAGEPPRSSRRPRLTRGAAAASRRT